MTLGTPRLIPLGYPNHPFVEASSIAENGPLNHRIADPSHRGIRSSPRNFSIFFFARRFLRRSEKVKKYRSHAFSDRNPISSHPNIPVKSGLPALLTDTQKKPPTPEPSQKLKFEDQENSQSVVEIISLILNTRSCLTAHNNGRRL